jgi:hypothetical protein
VVAVPVGDVLAAQVCVQRRVAAVLGVREGEVLPLVQAAAPVLVRQQERGLKRQFCCVIYMLKSVGGQ